MVNSYDTGLSKWEKNNDSWYYQDANGNYVIGWKEISGTTLTIQEQCNQISGYQAFIM